MTEHKLRYTCNMKCARNPLGNPPKRFSFIHSFFVVVVQYWAPTMHQTPFSVLGIHQSTKQIQFLALVVPTDWVYKIF